MDGARDELFVVSCTLHPRTLTPRYPVYRVDPLPLTVSSIMSATSASDICTPDVLSTKEFYLALPEETLRDVLLSPSDAKITLALIRVRIITARLSELNELESATCCFLSDCNSLVDDIDGEGN